jgi:hypothetical protein
MNDIILSDYNKYKELIKNYTYLMSTNEIYLLFDYLYKYIIQIKPKSKSIQTLIILLELTLKKVFIDLEQFCPLNNNIPKIKRNIIFNIEDIIELFHYFRSQKQRKSNKTSTSIENIFLRQNSEQKEEVLYYKKQIFSIGERLIFIRKILNTKEEFFEEELSILSKLKISDNFLLKIFN